MLDSEVAIIRACNVHDDLHCAQHNCTCNGCKVQEDMIVLAEVCKELNKDICTMPCSEFWDSFHLALVQLIKMV